MKTELESQIDFLMEIDKMKSILRQNWQLDLARQEDDAQHSWHISVTAMVLSPYAAQPVDLARVLPMLLVHDLVEIDAGDTYAYDEKGYEDKSEREKKAAARVFGLLPTAQGEAFLALWKEFEACRTPDSRFANAIDRVQPFFGNYYVEGMVWKKNKITVSQVLKRNAITREVLPEVWSKMEELIADSVEKGYLLPG